MERIDRKAELIRRMQEEMDHRAMVEEKAVQLITEGRHEEAVAQLNSLDDGILGEIQMEIDALDQEPTAREKAEERRRKAQIILTVLAEDTINMNWNYEEDFLKAITKGLKRAEEEGEGR